MTQTTNHDCTDLQIFLDDVIHGLSQPNKQLPCKYLYDENGSQLFDQICELDEYYLTRTELAIMNQYVGEMADQLGDGVMLVEFGSGSSIKTHILLNCLNHPAAYVPLDISEDHLLNTAEELRNQFTEIEILPVVADFTKGFELPVSTQKPSHSAVYFPGSTIGNFEPSQAKKLLSSIAELLGPDGGLLIGIDLRKNPAIIQAAYNDSQGVTEEFILNILHRANRELDANFDVDQFDYLANYNEELGRVEIWIVSKRHQVVSLDDHCFEFADGERILIEYSFKYRVDEFAQMAAQAGFELHKYWTDEDEMFAVIHLVKKPQ